MPTILSMLFFSKDILFILKCMIKSKYKSMYLINDFTGIFKYRKSKIAKITILKTLTKKRKSLQLCAMISSKTQYISRVDKLRY